MGEFQDIRGIEFVGAEEFELGRAVSGRAESTRGWKLLDVGRDV
jgi:hypothetical protein